MELSEGFLTHRYATVATCNLNQWAMDFEGNLKRIKQSVREAKKQGARLRLGPELEIPGYGCEDHFLENDTFLHSWESLAELLKDDTTDDIICMFGMPVMHAGVAYNCVIFCLNRKILLIRPKMDLANDGNYRELRFFTPWARRYEVDDHYLPRMIRDLEAGQEKVRFGVAAIATLDTLIAAEICEEVFVPESPHIWMGLQGVEIFCNPSGSHHQLRKLNVRMDLMKSATAKSGGVYMYANHQGCDGGRLYYDGVSQIWMNGEMKAQASQFSVRDVEVVSATIDLQDIRSYRSFSRSRCIAASKTPHLERVDVGFCLGGGNLKDSVGGPTPTMEPMVHTPEQEIAHGPPCWLWDYLRRSGLGGYFLPLSGGADSSSTAAMVGCMCKLVVEDVLASRQAGVADEDNTTLQDVRRVTGEPDFSPSDYKELCGKIFYCTYMGSNFSTDDTLNRAKNLAEAIGATFYNININKVTTALKEVFEESTGKLPKMANDNGSKCEDLALQNNQARSRMVLSYMMATLLPWANKGAQRGLLVLGSANVDEALRGYYTKYDCSAADINPIGGICKADLKAFLRHCAEEWPVLTTVVEAKPSAELGGSGMGVEQTDEEDMGMTYDELTQYAKIRKIDRCGPFSTFQKLVHTWGHLTPTQVATKVKFFFRMYSINRHKMTTLTPAYHAENYGPEDNRFDLRQFLYRASWDWQFARIDSAATIMEQVNS